MDVFCHGAPPHHAVELVLTILALRFAVMDVFCHGAPPHRAVELALTILAPRFVAMELFCHEGSQHRAVELVLTILAPRFAAMVGFPQEDLELLVAQANDVNTIAWVLQCTFVLRFAYKLQLTSSNLEVSSFWTPNGFCLQLSAIFTIKGFHE